MAREVGTPTGIRTPVAAVKGQCPRPLDDGRICVGGAHYTDAEFTVKRCGERCVLAGKGEKIFCCVRKYIRLPENRRVMGLIGKVHRAVRSLLQS